MLRLCAREANCLGSMASHRCPLGPSLTVTNSFIAGNSQSCRRYSQFQNSGTVCIQNKRLWQCSSNPPGLFRTPRLIQSASVHTTGKTVTLDETRLLLRKLSRDLDSGEAVFSQFTQIRQSASEKDVAKKMRLLVTMELVQFACYNFRWPMLASLGEVSNNINLLSDLSEDSVGCKHLARLAKVACSRLADEWKQIKETENEEDMKAAESHASSVLSLLVLCSDVPDSVVADLISASPLVTKALAHVKSVRLIAKLLQILASALQEVENLSDTALIEHSFRQLTHWLKFAKYDERFVPFTEDYANMWQAICSAIIDLRWRHPDFLHHLEGWAVEKISRGELSDLRCAESILAVFSFLARPCPELLRCLASQINRGGLQCHRDASKPHLDTEIFVLDAFLLHGAQMPQVLATRVAEHLSYGGLQEIQAIPSQRGFYLALERVCAQLPLDNVLTWQVLGMVQHSFHTHKTRLVSHLQEMQRHKAEWKNVLTDVETIAGLVPLVAVLSKTDSERAVMPWPSHFTPAALQPSQVAKMDGNPAVFLFPLQTDGLRHPAKRLSGQVQYQCQTLGRRGFTVYVVFSRSATEQALKAKSVWDLADAADRVFLKSS